MTMDIAGSVESRVEPASAEELAEILAAASRNGQRVAIRGGGTKGGGSLPAPADIVLSTRRLDAVLAHRDGDLTATVQAGATLADTNRTLATHRQWIPLDAPWSDRATIGGIAATNDAGPRRHRYGAPRDLIIGIDIVLADGTAAKAGGIVVKNVAGYDLSRLMTGSFGTLAVIVAATFKLFPIASSSRTVTIDLCDGSAKAPAERLAAILAALATSQLTPTAIELQRPPGRLLVRFETIETAAEQQAAAVVAMAADAGCATEVLSGDPELAVWEAHGERPWERDGAVVKVALLPAEIAPLVACLNETTGEHECDLIGRAGAGSLLMRIGGHAGHQATVVSALRERLPPGQGSAIVVRGSRELRALVDPWGPMGDALPLMREIKKRFDPLGVLNPGGGPGGL